VLSANNLPPVKRITNSADPYVEMLLLSPPPAPASEVGEDSSSSSSHALAQAKGQGQGETVSHHPLQVTGIADRTLFPEWREGFTFAPVEDPSAYVLFTVKDRGT
jgi:hypothetical protein